MNASQSFSSPLWVPVPSLCVSSIPGRSCTAVYRGDALVDAATSPSGDTEGWGDEPQSGDPRRPSSLRSDHLLASRPAPLTVQVLGQQAGVLPVGV